MTCRAIVVPIRGISLRYRQHQHVASMAVEGCVACMRRADTDRPSSPTASRVRKGKHVYPACEWLSRHSIFVSAVSFCVNDHAPPRVRLFLPPRPPWLSQPVGVTSALKLRTGPTADATSIYLQNLRGGGMRDVMMMVVVVVLRCSIDRAWAAAWECFRIGALQNVSPPVIDLTTCRHDSRPSLLSRTPAQALLIDHLRLCR